MVLITHTASKLATARIDHGTKVKYIQSAKMLKYIYQNNKYGKETVRNMIKQGKIDLTDMQICICGGISIPKGSKRPIFEFATGNVYCRPKIERFSDNDNSDSQNSKVR